MLAPPDHDVDGGPSGSRGTDNRKGKKRRVEFPTLEDMFETLLGHLCFGDTMLLLDIRSRMRQFQQQADADNRRIGELEGEMLRAGTAADRRQELRQLQLQTEADADHIHQLTAERDQLRQTEIRLNSELRRLTAGGDSSRGRPGLQQQPLDQEQLLEENHILRQERDRLERQHRQQTLGYFKRPAREHADAAILSDQVRRLTNQRARLVEENTGLRKAGLRVFELAEQRRNAVQNLKRERSEIQAVLDAMSWRLGRNSGEGAAYE